VSGVWTQTENDLLQAGIVHGLPAIVAILVLYLSFVISFVRMRKSNPSSSLCIGLSSAGILFVVLMLEFGLSIVALGRNSFRHTFIVWEMLILSLLILGFNQQNNKRSSCTNED
jgi:hypothetical protein